MPRRVVITGIGLITPLGNQREANWEAILAARSGIGQITRFDTSQLTSAVAGEVRGFEHSEVLEPKAARHYDRFIHLAVQATAEALADAKWVFDAGWAERTGVTYGSAMGGLSTILQAENTLRNRGARRVSPFLTPGSGMNMAAGVISIQWKLRGPNYATASACSTSAHAIADGFYAIQRGDADMMVTGGSEAVITEVTVASFDNARALSRRMPPAEASRPFDADRDGFVIAEGGATVILEEREHARSRGARIYAELVGVGMAADAYHITAPDPTGAGAARAMAQALRAAGLPIEAVGYVNAHATSTQLGDVSETAAIKSVFGRHAYRLAVSSTKSMTGHLLGAAGAAEAAYTALALYHRVLPPTINLDRPDPACDLDYVPHHPRPLNTLEVALSNSNGFGGANVCLVLRRGDG